MPDADEVLPKYLQIAGRIRDEIVRGDLAPGAEVPSERELAASWGVARPTAARALEWLRNQGFVESRRGAGTYVRAQAVAPRARERYDRARELGTMYGATESVRFLAVEVVTGPPPVLDALRLPSESLVIRRARLLSGAGARPLEYSTSWFPAALADLAPRLLRPERLLGGTAKHLAEVLRRRPAYAREQASARLASPEERHVLALPDPAAVLVHWHTVFDAEDAPLQVDVAVYPQDRWTLRQEYELPSD